MRKRTRPYARLALLALALAGPAGAAELFLSEIVEGSSNNKAVEVFNGSGAEVDLAAGGYRLQFFFNGNTSPGLTIPLAGTVAAGDVHVVAHSSSVAAILAEADQTNGSSWFNGDDAIVLLSGDTILDVAGQIGFDPGSQWGSGLSSTADNTLRRKAGICAGDTDGSDAFDPALEWDGYPNDTFDGLGSHTATCAGGGTPTDPAASGGASPASLAAGDPTLLTVDVTPGANPESTGLSVTADLGVIGGSASQALYDDGSHGDETAGDLRFSFLATVAEGTPPGPKSLPVSVEDGEGRSAAASIALSVVAKVAIAEIQGSGVGSPLPLGTELVTEGIVTARRANGYFIQSAPGQEDGDPATAEGLFVFTSAPPPAAAAVGSRVRVAGRVGQFRRTPHGFPLTQLTNSSLTVIATGEALPPPVLLDASVLAPDVPVDALGRYQGMRVQVPTAVVTGPSNGFGDFHVTLAGVPRPAREPGVAVLDAVPLPPEKAIPRFDRNPERLRVESRGLADAPADNLNLDAGALVEGLSGVLYYDRGDFTLLMGERSGVSHSGGAQVRAVPAAGKEDVRVGSYNIQNLSGGAAVDPARLAKLSEVFCQYLRLPDVVGLIEIGDLATAQRLAQAINDDEFGHCPDDPQYQAHLLAASGSQRLGFLVKTAPAATGEPRVQVLDVVEHFVGEPLLDPQGNASSLVLFDRPPLHLSAVVNGDNGEDYPLEVLLNHTLSLLDVNSLNGNATWGTLGERARQKRRQQAERLSQLVEAIQSADPSPPLVLIGDYNAFEFSDGYVDVIGIISGKPAPANEVLVPGDSAVTVPLTNLLETVPAEQRYSYVFEGNTQSLDHALVNAAALASADAQLYHARVNADFAADLAADPTVPVRSSDHDPLVAELMVPRFLDADLAVKVEGPFLPVRDGQLVPFLALVRNLGADRAVDAVLELRLDALADQLRLVWAPGWTCEPPVADGDGSRLSCRRDADLAAGESDLLGLILEARRHSARQTIGVAATADTRSRDLRTDNDADADGTRVVGKPRR
ncbi:lamin tail domain-containing protein [Arenimonas fontis]|nr:lamin tail domain-containing protein [Arenimonas fontis]